MDLRRREMRSPRTSLLNPLHRCLFSDNTVEHRLDRVAQQPIICRQSSRICPTAAVPSQCWENGKKGAGVLAFLRGVLQPLRPQFAHKCRGQVDKHPRPAKRQASTDARTNLAAESAATQQPKQCLRAPLFQHHDHFGETSPRRVYEHEIIIFPDVRTAFQKCIERRFPDHASPILVVVGRHLHKTRPR